MFTITADQDPLRNLVINYTPVNVSPSDFLKVDTTHSPPLSESGTLRNVTILSTMWTEDDDNGDSIWTAEFGIPTVDDNIDENQGSISVTLSDPDSSVPNDYTVSTTSGESSAEVVINDNDAPEISIIEPTSQSLAKDDIELILVASIEPANDLQIRFRPTETDTNFLDPTGGTTPDGNSRPGGTSGTIRTSEALEFTGGSGRPYTTILKIATQRNSNTSDSSGTILVELQDDNSAMTTYTITTDSTKLEQNDATATIIDRPNPTLSIAYNGSPIREGESATFVVTANIDPLRELDIYYTPSITGTDFLKVSDGAKDTMRIAEDKAWTPVPDVNPTMWTTEITIQTRDPDTFDTDHGEIILTLNPPESSNSDEYTVSSTLGEDRDNVTVFDLEEPEISIYPPATAVFNGENAEFTLESNILPWQPVDIWFTPSNSDGEFLDDQNDADHDTGYTSDRPYSQTVNFTRDPTTGKFHRNPDYSD